MSVFATTFSDALALLATFDHAVAEIVLRLNERRLGKSGRVHLTPGPKKNRGG